MMIPELGPKGIEDLYESQRLSEYYMENTRQEVYIVIAFGFVDREPFGNISGVYKNLEDAKETMINGIKSMKEDCRSINFEDPEEWEIISEDELCYEGYTPNDNFSYSVYIEKWEVL